MIICQCNIITERRIEEAVIRLLEDDPWQLIVPMQVYHALGKSGRCRGCFPNVVDITARTREEFHKRRGLADAESISLLNQPDRENPRLSARRRPTRRAGSGRSAA